jgi:hypothetical protein
MRWQLVPLFGLITACTQQPHLIKPIPTDDLHYALRSCDVLGAKLKETYVELAHRSQIQQNLADGSGSENASHIALLKGRQNTILDTMARKNCPVGGQEA